MSTAVRLAISVFILASASFAQDAFDVVTTGRQRWPADDAHRIYLAACTTVEREFSSRHAIRPRFTLILGATANLVGRDQREIRLEKWNPYLFAQGVVELAFEDLMTSDEWLAISKRAVTLADSTVDVGRLRK